MFFTQLWLLPSSKLNNDKKLSRHFCWRKAKWVFSFFYKNEELTVWIKNSRWLNFWLQEFHILSINVFFISVLLFQKALSLLLSFEAEKPKRKSNSTLVDLSDQLLFGSCLKDSNRRILWDRAFGHKTRKRHFVWKFEAFSSFFSLKNQLATLLINRKHYPLVLNELLGVEWRASDLWATVFRVELH